MTLLAIAFLSKQAAGQPSPTLAAFQAALTSAKTFSANYIVQPIGGLRTEYTLDMQKPNSLRILMPGKTICADGQNIMVYVKAKNEYYEQPENGSNLGAIFAPEALAVWLGFLNPAAYQPVGYREMGEVARGPNNYVGVEAKYEDEDVTYLLDPATNLLREATFQNSDAEGSDVLFVKSVSINQAEPSVFSFTPPSGSREVTQEELEGPTWHTGLFSAEQAAAASKEKILVEFYDPQDPQSIKLEKEVLFTDKFNEMVKNHFVLARLNGKAMKRIAQKYTVNTYPTIAFLDAKGKLIQAGPGYPGADAVYAFIQSQM